MSRVWTQQPQISTGIDWSNHLTKGLRAAFIGNSARDIVNNVSFVSSGGGKSVTTAGIGLTKYWIPPELTSGSRSANLYDAIAPPITIFTLSNAAANSGMALARGNGSGNVAFGCGAYYGSSSGGRGVVRTTGGTLTINPASFYFDTRLPTLTVLSIGATSTNLYSGQLGSIKHSQSGSTPSGNFYYEYGDIYRCLTLGGAYSDDGKLILGGLVFGEAWDKEKVSTLFTNPWQIFQPLPSRIFVGPAAAVTNPSGDLAATETDGDTSAFTGIVLVQGTAAATETGDDTFAATGGAVTATGTLAATEAGDDTATSTGTVLVKGALAATDSGSDTATSTGTVLVQGTAAATDSGTDTFAATGGSITTATGTLDATEVGSDSATSSGTILVQGLLAALETGGDTVYIDGQIYIVGACAATETGSDTFAAGSVIPSVVIASPREGNRMTQMVSRINVSVGIRNNHSTGRRT